MAIVELKVPSILKRAANVSCFFILLVAFNSCQIVRSLKELGLEKSRIKEIPYSNKKILFMPMHHLGKQAFFDDVKIKLDSLRKIGYVIFYEGIGTGAKGALKDTLNRKERKLMGLSTTSSGYKQAVKDTPMENYVAQDNKKILQINIDQNVDVTLKDILTVYEHKYRPIVLTDYDFRTPLDSAYTGKKQLKKSENGYITKDYRNRFVADYIKSSKYEKIVIVFGFAHYKGMKKELNKKS